MAEINFGLLQNAQNGFQNALANGMRAGAAVGEFFQGRQEAQQRNALSAYAANPTREGLGALAKADPNAAMSERTRFDQQDAAQRTQQDAQNDTVRRLLRQAGASPEGWQQAMGAAHQMGIDTTRFPQQFDPQWTQTQMLILDARSDPATRDQLDRDMERLGFTDPNQPGYREAVTELILMSRAREGQDESGRPTLEMPRITLPGQQGAPPPQQAQAPQGMAPGADQFTPEMWRANVERLGQGPAIDWAVRNGIPIPITGDSDYDSLPSGAMFRAPDGTMRRKP